MMSAPRTPPYAVFNGYRYPHDFDQFVDSLTYEARPDDLFIVTYPKSGTTWAQMIVTRILHGGEMPERFFKKGINEVSPFPERFGKQTAVEAERPCSIKTHLPYELSFKHPRAKNIVVFRNIKDVAVSYYYMLKRYYESEMANIDFHSFLSFLMRGEIAYDDYFNFVISWWNQRANPNILILLYEDMKMDAAGNILRIADFMGTEYGKLLRRDGGRILQHITENTSFEAAKKQLNQSEQKECMKDFFTRKGIVGDWKNHFTGEESRLVDTLARHRLESTDLMARWDAYEVFGAKQE